LVLVLPDVALGKIAITRAIIVEVHAPGSAKGMKHGAVTLTRMIGNKKDTFVSPLNEYTELTGAGEKGREKTTLKDLKPGMVAVVEIYGDRIPGEQWQLGMLHVLGSAEDADPELAKILAPFEVNFPATVTRVGPPSAARKGDLGQVEALWGKLPYIFRVTKRTEILWQAPDGKFTPAMLDDVKIAEYVWIRYLAPLAAGEPPVVPATRIILDARYKKPR
jgi:hypothetical protein